MLTEIVAAVQLTIVVFIVELWPGATVAGLNADCVIASSPEHAAAVAAGLAVDVLAAAVPAAANDTRTSASSAMVARRRIRRTVHSFGSYMITND
jgi:hypothetical protein